MDIMRPERDDNRKDVNGRAMIRRVRGLKKGGGFEPLADVVVEGVKLEKELTTSVSFRVGIRVAGFCQA
jgi:hypothetical protein